MSDEFNIVTRMTSLDAIDTNGIPVCRVASSTPKEVKDATINTCKESVIRNLPIKIMHGKACIT